MQKIGSKIDQRYFYWGYGFGGFLCFLSLLSLSLGLTPLLLTLRNKPLTLQLPGTQILNLKLPGAYLAVGLPQGLSAKELEQIYDLQYSLTDKAGDESLPIVKAQPKRYLSDKEDKQIPLFQFVTEKAGIYLLNSGYIYDIEGAKINAVLFHIDVRYVRTELLVGIILFFILAGLGLYFIRKTYQRSAVIIKRS